MSELEVNLKTKYSALHFRGDFAKSKKEIWHRAGVHVLSVVVTHWTVHRGHGALAALPDEALAPVIPEFQ